MASRVTKQPNLTGTEFATAGSPLRVADLDADLGAIFSSITNANVAVGAGIATAKLASDAGIIAAMLAPNSVTTSKITDANVTLAKLALNASTQAFGSGTVAAAVLSSVGDTTLATIAGFVSRGGRVLFLGTVAAIATLAATGTTVIFKLKRGVTTIATWQSTGFAQTPNTGSTIGVPLFLPVNHVDVPGSGTFTYTL